MRQLKRAWFQFLAAGPRPLKSAAPLLAFLVWLPCAVAAPAEATRLVVIKCDGVPERLVERVMEERDPRTGQSRLPWIQRVFAGRGTRLRNFYTRGLSLSAPSWSLLDTGAPPRIKGNVEFDRYTLRVYDYMNFFPFYLSYARSRRADMPGVEVLDEAGIPLLSDRFELEERFQGFQLYQRGVYWRILKRALQSGFGESVRRWLDEWQPGLEMGRSLHQQTERELTTMLAHPAVKYLDLFTGDFDHLAHLDRNTEDQKRKLEQIDALVGRLWTAIGNSPLKEETLLVLVSDHGMNTSEKTFSQGYNLIDLFRGAAGGAHHVITNRYPLTDYKLRGFNMFVSNVTTASGETAYLRGEEQSYPTALLDLDGNERASVYLRNSDWNVLHILAWEMGRADMPAPVRRAAARAFVEIVDRYRGAWEGTVAGMQEELGALRRSIEAQRANVAKLDRIKWTREDHRLGRDDVVLRARSHLQIAQNEEREYAGFVAALRRLLGATAQSLERSPVKVEELIPRRAMGDLNTASDLRHYAADIAPGGLRLDAGGNIDFQVSFRWVDYPALLAAQSVRNNVQEGVSSHPVDFTALRLPPEADAGTVVLLYGQEDRQARILGRRLPDGRIELKYSAVGGWRNGLPLELWEDPDFAVPAAGREAWFAEWHDDREWLKASHRARHSTGVIGLYEHFARNAPLPKASTEDEKLLARLEQRRRRLVESDLLIVARDNWNFNVRGFNPGGNHGSFLRVSTHSVWMMAGGGVPAGLEILEPYDSLSFAPTLLGLTGRDKEACASRYFVRELARGCR